MNRRRDGSGTWRSTTQDPILADMREATEVPRGSDRPRVREPGPGTEPANAEEIRTFLIADIRGYTVFTEDRGDEAAARLAAKFAAIVRQHVEDRDGSVIELRGDEALAVFRSPRQAIRTAVELQTRFLEATMDSPDLPLPVGIGLDAGEAVAVEGGYRGGALNLAARLCSEAGPGEILGSQSVVHLARTVEAIRYIDRGALRLKGLAEPVRVLSIASEGIDVAGRMRALSPKRSGNRVYGGKVQFRILGPLEVAVSGAAVALGGRKQQAVLAHLIVHRNELVPADTLVDELWGEAPPDYARNNVQTYISHLRRALGRDRIEWRPPGYLLTRSMPPSWTRPASRRWPARRGRYAQQIRAPRSTRSTTRWRCGGGSRSAGWPSEARWWPRPLGWTSCT